MAFNNNGVQEISQGSVYGQKHARNNNIQEIITCINNNV